MRDERFRKDTIFLLQLLKYFYLGEVFIGGKAMVSDFADIFTRQTLSGFMPEKLVG